ncbi:MAG: zinc ribbon domain-containing protein, partial [Acidimicrobiia bacterium]
MVCPTCSTANAPGRKYCSQCGGRLALSCEACGAANQPGDRFCGECGSALDTDLPQASSTAEAVPQAPPAAERR